MDSRISISDKEAGLFNHYVRQIEGQRGIRHDLPKRRARDILSPEIEKYNFGITIMSHCGGRNGRLSVLLSSIPENYKITVSDDAIEENDIALDKEICEWHGAEYHHHTPWSGRAGNAINAMKINNFDVILFLNDDIWMFPECVSNALRWYHILTQAGIPVGGLSIPQWETWGTGEPSCHGNYKMWGFSSWDECLLEPWRLEAVPPNPAYSMPQIGHVFGACMLITRQAYNDSGGFPMEFWAEDDAFNYTMLKTGKYISIKIPGRGYIHYGAQSWNRGETQETVGSWEKAYGISPEESQRIQTEIRNEWQQKIGNILARLGGA